MHGPEAGRAVIITGGSSGIGRASARLFAERGWRVGIIARGHEGLEATRRDLASDGAIVATATADVADSEALRTAAATLVNALGRLDVWINNAAVGSFARFTDTTEAEFRRITDVNYLGTVNGTRIALSYLLPRNAGSIVNICSAIGFRGTPLQSPYSGAKYAMRGFTEALRAELLNQGSRVHLGVVYPPAVNTPFYNHAISRVDGMARPPPPVYQPELIAEAIYLAATTRRRDVLVGGQSVQLRLLNALAPSLADWALSLLGPRLQMSSRPALAEDHDDNVFSASRKPAGEHGPFDSEALSTSAQFWVTRNRGLLAGLSAAAVTLLLMSQRR